MRSVKVDKNVPDWQPTGSDYVLVFLEVNGIWRECSNNVPEFHAMTLADYLEQMDIVVPDYTQFLRIVDDERGLHFEYKVFGGRVTIYVTWRENWT